ncbi:MAG: ketoacyl-ACP synthase III [Hyphomicrobium sp.]
MSIEAIAWAVPGCRQTAADIADQTGLDEEFIVNKVGIRTRYILNPDETGVELAMSACTKLMTQSGITADLIDVLVFVTQTPDHAIPHNSALLSARLGLPSRCACFDIGLGCSGYVYALSIVEGFLSINGLTNAILVTCDPYSRIMAAGDKATNAVFGDAATATWIKRDGTRTSLGEADFGTDGSQASAIMVEAGRARWPMVSLHHDELQSYDRDQLRLRMAGRDVFNFVLSRVPESISACLVKNGLKLSDIDYFALHQGSLHMLKAAAQKLGIEDQKLLVNIGEFGNTVSSTVPMLLSSLMDRADLKGTKILVCGFGVGLSWATNVITFSH